jgi:probable HAF family extracellular repeat protein
MNKRNFLAMAVVLSAFLGLIDIGPVYSGGTMTDIGSLGYGYAQALGINNNGKIVGFALGTSSYNHAFLYSDGKMIDLHKVSGYYGESSANAINESGQVAGYTTIATPTDKHAFLYSGGQMAILAQFSGAYSTASGINKNGQITGSANFPSDLTTVHAFLYSGGAMTDLGALRGGKNSGALGINDQGKVVGYSDTKPGNPGFTDQRAFLHNGDQMINLGILGEKGTSHWSCARGINNFDQVVGDSSTSVGYGHAFLYSGGVMIDLGTLPGHESSCATAINDKGEIAGWSEVSLHSFPYTTTRHAFLISNGVMRDLGTLPGDEDSEALGINNRGQVVGYSGTYRAFLYSPPTASGGIGLLLSD